MTAQVEPADAKPSGRRLAFGAGALGIVGILKLCVQAASLPVMARLLGPSETAASMRWPCRSWGS